MSELIPIGIGIVITALVYFWIVYVRSTRK